MGATLAQAGPAGHGGEMRGPPRISPRRPPRNQPDRDSSVVVAYAQGPEPASPQLRVPGLHTNILHMLTKRLTKIGDSTGIVIDRPILDMLGLDKGDEVSLRIDADKLIIERADQSVTRSKRRAKLQKARARMQDDIGGTLRKLAK
jgi:antitoxin component of MazEF toxin-antitoxin module